jgi:tetratricopeptide (TPR) repeat protein
LAGLPAIQALSALVLAAALGLGTAYQHVYWANDIVLFHHSLSVAPGNAIAQNAFGNALSAREMNDEAITVFESLVQQEPYNPTALYNLGYNYYKVGRYKEAVPSLATAVEINPKDERQYLTLGVTLFFLDKYDAAEGVLRQGITVRRDGLGLHYALGAVLKQTGRLEEAFNEFNQEVVYNPEYVSAYDQMNQIKQQMRTGAPQSKPPTSGGSAEPR